MYTEVKDNIRYFYYLREPESDYETEKSRISRREEAEKQVQKFNLLSDTFMSVALSDKKACQHVLRIITGIQDLTVKEVRTQYRFSKNASHDAILDVLAEDGQGRLYNMEIQRSDTIDHTRRTRFYGSMIDSEYLEKGKTYSEMPEVYIIYISETDIWEKGKTVYPVVKMFEGTDIRYEDGIHIIYVNTAVDDCSEIAGLMTYFKTADPNDMSQGDLSRRVQSLKNEKGGAEAMCEVTEWFERQGELRKAKEIVFNLLRRGISVEEIAEITNVKTEIVQNWINETVLVS